MKIFGFKSALAMLTFSTMSLFFQAPTQAQVNKQLLSDVIKSCHRDMNVEYFEKMGINAKLAYQIVETSSLPTVCIKHRYYYVSVIEQLPWLPDSGGILPNYPASAALSVLFTPESSPNLVTEDKILECVTSKNFDGSNECSWIQLKRRYQYKDSKDYLIHVILYDFLPSVCLKCVVTHDDASKSELNRGFINWFLSLDKSKRRDVVSFLSSGKIWLDLNDKRNMAGQAYEDALKKIEQDDKEQRRRNLLGQ